MSFLNPMLLAGLGAVAVPVLIHLLHRRKFQKVVWAAMRFVQASVEKNRRRLLLEDLVLLALRCLLVALLALALARPAARRLAHGLFGSQITAVVVLDNSYSMGLSDGTRTRFDKAKAAALQALDVLPAGSAVAVLLASDLVQGLIPQPTFDLGLARRVLREAALSDRGSDLAPAVRQAIDLLKKHLSLRGEVYLITDGQSVAWRRLALIHQALEEVQDKAQAHILLVDRQEQPNVGVSDLAPGSGLLPVRQPIRCRVRVTNFGREEVRQVRVTLKVDAEPPCDEFTLDTLPAGEHREVSLSARFPAEGYHSVTARLAGDRLPADDQRTVVVRAIPGARVLLVDGDPGTEARESETFFLRHALQPVPAEQRASYFIQPTLLLSDDLAGVRFDDYEAVILANVARVSEAQAAALERYVRQGGGLLVFGGAKLDLGFYNEVLAGRHHLLPARLGPARGQAEQDEKFFALEDRVSDHPVVSLWSDPASGTLSSARFYRALELLPGTVTLPLASQAGQPTRPGPDPAWSESRTILRFDDGRPALMESDLGLGRSILFSSTADTEWNDLPVRPYFVPLMHRLLGALVGRQDEGLNVRVGEKFVHAVPEAWLGREAAIVGPRSAEGVVPETRRIEMADGRPVLGYDQTDLGGCYEARVSGLEPAAGLRFAAQPDVAESDLEALTLEQRELLASVARVSEWGPGFSWRQQIERQRRGAEFWQPLLLAVLGLAVMETALAQWFSRSR